eukprot:TRINITY_DN5034_c0_g1_i1.p1 TRINITY_DN5034_c0_g1~~TRINITY_DN5034_c0_g1_i1.p1  ORF type:complete len:188 (-),score=41.87 TRINITY_DN5034_c0_g1_i1:211-774(-)
MPGKDALDMSLDDRIKQAQKDRRKRKASPGNNNSSTTNTKKAATGTGITTQASKRPKRNLSSSGAKNKRPAPLPNIKVTIVNDKAKTKAAAPAAAKPKPAARTTRNSNRKASINNGEKSFSRMRYSSLFLLKRIILLLPDQRLNSKLEGFQPPSTLIVPCLMSRFGTSRMTLILKHFSMFSRMKQKE